MHHNLRFLIFLDIRTYKYYPLYAFSLSVRVRVRVRCFCSTTRISEVYGEQRLNI